MYDQNYDPAVGAGLGIFFWLIILGAYLFMSYLQYRIAKKCGCDQNAFWSFIPIMNVLLMCEMAEKPYWWTVLMFIPLVGLITGIILWVRIAENAGHHGGWGVAMFVPFVNLIALLYLAFSSGGPKRTSPPLVSGDRPRTPQSVG